MPLRPWTEQDDAALRAMVAEGLPSIDVAAKLDRTRDAVRLRANRIGVSWAGTHAGNRKSAGGKTTGAAARAKRLERMAEARALFHDGLTRREIAAQMGLSMNAINRYCSGLVRPEDHRAAMQRFRKPKPAAAPRLTKAELLADRVVKCRALGMTVEQMADELKASRGTVRAAAKIAGLELKRPAASPKPRKEPKIRRVNWNRVAMPAPSKAPLPNTTAAAQFLGRWFKPVYRASIADPKAPADEYIVGRLRMPAVEMLDVARSRGFAG